MRIIAPVTALLSALAAPALAHEGAHVHPHGYEAMISVLVILAIAGLALYALRR